MTIIFYITSINLALFIVTFSSMNLFFGIKYLLITKLKKKYDWIILGQQLISFGWVIIFGYILWGYITQHQVIAPGSLGSIFIRPLILMSSVIQSIWMYIRYKFEESGGCDKWNLQKKQ